MFDETQDAPQAQTPPAPSAPAQTPRQEPVDMFKDTESPPDSFVPASGGAPEADISGPSAFEAGKLKPKLIPDAAAAEMVQSNGMSGGEIHAPTALRRILLALGILVVAAIIAGAVWWFVSAQQKSPSPQQAVTQTPPTPAKTETPPAPSPEIVNVDVNGAPQQPASSTPSTVAATSTQFVVPPPQKPTASTTASSTDCTGQTLDSDKDGLTDCEEINIYHTDPHNPDTDGDGLTDGVEVYGRRWLFRW
ncbi:hypothetical protein HY065_02535 [Candidatus Berkelbacteria bacterium]|nr:hypothetical protein [Candidatus Berkelbacteria bacterium]